MYFDYESKKKIFARLHKVMGQLDTADKMFLSKRSYPDVCNILLASESGLHNLIAFMLEEAIRKDIALLFNTPQPSFPLTMEELQQLESLKNKFYSASLRQMPYIAHELMLLKKIVL